MHYILLYFCSVSSLRKSFSDDSAVSCLVLGTEAAAVYILDPVLRNTSIFIIDLGLFTNFVVKEAFTILESMALPAAPSHVAVGGLYEVDFRYELNLFSIYLFYENEFLL